MNSTNFATPKRKHELQDKIQIPASPFLRKIGFGTGVAVYEFNRSPMLNKMRSPWAVKKILRRQKDNLELTTRLKDEAKILRDLNHPNIVGFRAFVQSVNEAPMLAMEECTTSLGDLIEEKNEMNNSEPFIARYILILASDITNGLNYLHNEALILHCDIKSYNILIKDDFLICKLCDFGVCLPLTKDGVINEDKVGTEVEYIGTRLWAAPEVLNCPQYISTKADIYSFGLVLWEMISLSVPFWGNDVEDSDIDQSESDENIIVRQRPDLPKIALGDDYNIILELFYITTEESPEQRPTSQILYCMLKDLKLN